MGDTKRSARWALLGTYVLILGGLVAVVPGLGSPEATLDAASPFDPGLVTVTLDGTTITASGDVTGEQSLTNAQGCVLNQGGPGLLQFDGGSKSVGLVDGSIGVKSKGNGQDCGQFEGAEELTVQLGLGLDEYAAYRAELDIEVLQDAGLTATAVFVDGDGDEAVVGSFTLLTGTEIPSPPPPGIDNTPLSTNAEPLAYCNPQSSSGPNSSESDNCYWTIESDSPFNRLSFTEDFDGKASLQGGGDWPASGPGGPTVFYLTDAPDGILRCGDTITTPPNPDIQGTITRLGIEGVDPDCELKPYSFQVVGAVVQFEPEGSGARYTGAITKTIPEGTVLNNTPPATDQITVDWIEYDKDGGGGDFDFVPMQWCENNDLDGTTLPSSADADGESATWCVYEVNLADPDGSDVTATFSVYGEDDPHWR